MKRPALFFAAFLLVSCSGTSHQVPIASPSPTTHRPPTVSPSANMVSATSAPTLVATPDLVGTLVAKGVTLEITFDGNTCAVAGPQQVTTGEQVFLLTNLSGRSAYLWVGRQYPGVTWQDVLDAMGPSGSYSTVPQGVAIVVSDHLAFEGTTLSYRQYTFQFEGEYHVVVEGRRGDLMGFWPCGPFTVVAAP